MGEPAVWTTIAIQPESEMIWFDTGMEQSNQWAELHMICLMVVSEAPPLTICINSGALYWGLALRISVWHAKNGWLCIDNSGDRLCGKTYGG